MRWDVSPGDARFAYPRSASLQLFDGALHLTSVIALPRWAWGSGSLTTHGRFVFHAADGAKKYVVVKADDAPGMALDSAVLTFWARAPARTAAHRTGMRVAELWRYPVKSMAGERLGAAEVRGDGIAGDRVLWVAGAEGGVVTARTRHRLLGHHAVLAPDGAVLVDGRPWTSADVSRDVEAAAGAGARLAPSEGLDRYDVLPLLVATDGAIAALGVDGRRFRPNVVVGGVEGMAERGWPGQHLVIGDCVIAVARLRPRCVMTTYDPDTLAQDVSVLRRIAQELDGAFALDCAVVRPGTIRVGDAVALVDAPLTPAAGSGR